MRKKNVVLVASFGGHFVQAQRIAPIFDEYNITVVSTKRDLEYSPDCSVDFELIDCNFRTPVKVLICFVQSIKLWCKTKPVVVVSTGAAPGCIFCIVSKILGAKVIWIDSIANAKDLSLSGKLISYFTKFVYTQWGNVAKLRNVKFLGRLI